MENETNHTPGNQSEKYLYIPTEKDFMELYDLRLKRDKRIKKQKNVYCFFLELLFVFIYFVLFIYFSLTAADTIGVAMVLLFPVFLAVCWFVIRANYRKVYWNSIRQRAANDKWFLARRWISYDGYHLVSENDHQTLMLVVRDSVKVEIENKGIILNCPDGYRYYPARIFGSMRKMYEFYELLDWNNVYEEKYERK